MFKIVDGKRFPLTAEEIASREAFEQELIDQLPDRMREKRDSLLLDSDWTHTSDHTPDLTPEKKAEWATYRQALRDLPTHEEWPEITEHWPTPPE